MTPQTGEVNFFGKKLPAQTEHKFLLLAAAIGVIGTIILIRKGQSGPAASSTPTAVGSGSGSSTNTGGGTPGVPTPGPSVDPLSTVEFKFSEDTSNSAEFQGQSNVAQGGGGHLSFLGFSIGGGGGGSNVKSTHVKTGASNLFSSDVTVHGSEGTIKGVEDWLTALVGTQQQRTGTTLQELQAGSQYVGGTGVTPYVTPPASPGGTR